MAQAGAVLGGRYVLDEHIGSGGYGEVWRATDMVLARSVAIKLLHPHYAGQAKAMTRFRAEARHAAALSHENIARVYDYGEAAGGQPPYLVMEFVAGTSLEAVLASGPLDATRTMDIVAQTAAGLQAAHAAGMIHRDVKPGNLLLNQNGTVKITDFGIAHTVDSASVTVSGELIGTPGYLAPERAVGERAGPASDLYSLGIVAYECLTGTRPFSGTPLEIVLAHRDRPLPPLAASAAPAVAAFVMRLTAKDPAHRLGDAAEVTVWAALLRDGAGSGRATGRRGPVIPSPAGTWTHRRLVLTYAGAAFAAVIVIVVASLIGFASPSRPVAASPAPVRTSATPTPRDSGVAAPSSHRPAASPVRATGPAVPRPPAPVVPAVSTVRRGHGDGPGNGNRPGNKNGKGPGNGEGKGHENGNGPGKGKGGGSSQGD